MIFEAVDLVRQTLLVGLALLILVAAVYLDSRGARVTAPFQGRLSDRTDRSPLGYRVRPRRFAEIRAAVCHQMGVGTWAEDNPMFDRVRAHFVVMESGLVLQLHPITQRMRYGCGHGNAWAINIEFAGTLIMGYRDSKAIRWKARALRCVDPCSAPQIEAGRALLAWLKGQVPGLQVGAHRQLDEDKGGCPGPEIYREVCQYGIDALGMPLDADQRRLRHPLRLARLGLPDLARIHRPSLRRCKRRPLKEHSMVIIIICAAAAFLAVLYFRHSNRPKPAPGR